MQTPNDPWNEPQPEKPQFSLSGLIWLVTMIALALAPLRWLPAGIYAGALALAALVFLAVVTWGAADGAVIQTRRAYVLLLYWCLLLLYIAAALMAVVDQDW